MANNPGTPRTVEMPASTPAPLLSAAGLALLFVAIANHELRPIPQLLNVPPQHPHT